MSDKALIEAPAPKLGPNSSQHPVDYSSVELAVAAGWRKAMTDLLQTMICSSVQIVNGEEVVGYQIKTGALHQIVGLSNGELWFPIGLPSVAEQSASATSVQPVPWVSVNDRMPTIGEDVLCWTGWHITGKYDGSEWRTEDDSGPIFMVTHWMPLPAAPTPAQGEGHD